MGKRITAADGTYRVEGKQRPGDGSWRRTAAGWALDRMCDGQRLHVTARTQNEARKAMRELVKRIDAGLPPRDATITFGAWLTEWRGDMLDARQSKRGPLKITTKDTYRTLSQTHVLGREADAEKKLEAIPADPISEIPLDKLKASDIDRLMVRMKAKGKSDSSRRQVYHIVRIALEAARRDRLIALNPATDVDRPVVEGHEAKYLSPADVVRLLEAARGLRYHEVLALVAVTGLRRGEALALKVKDLDLVSGVASVRGTLARIGGKLVVTTTKTKGSTRKVVLVPAVVDMLARLADKRDQEREHAGNLWTDTGFVFTTETGQPVDPRNVFRTMQVAAKKAKIEGVGIHTLRHSVATGMMDSGENVKVVSGLLGHSSAEITLDTYTHETPEAQRRAVESWAAKIGL
jgi:integrase